jgi:hypothetical protein
MFGSGILGLAIGLILIYFLLSLICSGASEILEGVVLHRRSKFLEAGLADLLGPELKTRFYAQPLIQGLHAPQSKPKQNSSATSNQAPSYIPSKTAIDALLSIATDAQTKLASGISADGAGPITFTIEDPTAFPPAPFHARIGTEVFRITATGDPNRTTWTADRATEGTTAAGHEVGDAVERVRPTNLEASQVLVGVQADIDRLPPGKARDALANLLRTAGNDMDKWQAAAEKWFDDVMDRISGWYKRRTKLILFAIGLVLVVTVNADTLVFARAFWKDQTLRDSVTAAAQQVVQTGNSDCHPTGGNAAQVDFSCITDAVNNLKGLNLPIGWPGSKHPTDPRGAPWWLKLFGLLITAGALTLGAPFWFDLLNKFVNFRSSGSPPQRSTGTVASGSPGGAAEIAPPEPVPLAITVTAAGSAAAPEGG